ncbi:MAG: hypothetical protein LBG27_04810 [Spirochaetaceae bacterium]|nr:hypothetical protein [Spirochaetaceae bacterium]
MAVTELGLDADTEIPEGVTVDANSAAPMGTVKAIGTVSVSGNIVSALNDSDKGDISGATLANSAAATVTLPATAGR